MAPHWLARDSLPQLLLMASPVLAATLLAGEWAKQLAMSGLRFILSHGIMKSGHTPADTSMVNLLPVLAAGLVDLMAAPSQPSTARIPSK